MHSWSEALCGSTMAPSYHGLRQGNNLHWCSQWTDGTAEVFQHWQRFHSNVLCRKPWCQMGGNTTEALHFGGLCDAALKSCKSLLRREMGQQVLTFETLYTVLSMAEASSNFCPMSSMSSDANNLAVLTPDHSLDWFSAPISSFFQEYPEASYWAYHSSPLETGLVNQL